MKFAIQLSSLLSARTNQLALCLHGSFNCSIAFNTKPMHMRIPRCRPAYASLCTRRAFVAVVADWANFSARLTRLRDGTTPFSVGENWAAIKRRSLQGQLSNGVRRTPALAARVVAAGDRCFPCTAQRAAAVCSFAAPAVPIFALRRLTALAVRTAICASWRAACVLFSTTSVHAVPLC